MGIIDKYNLLFTTNPALKESKMSVGSSKHSLCRLCLNIINDTDFEVIEEIISGILQVVLPHLDRETKDRQTMCRTCHENLIAAYNFKSMCIDIEDVIISYINPKDMLAVELKDVYLNEKGNVHLTDISENQKICRLCMQMVMYEYGFVSLNELDIDIINEYIPQININATKDPVICGLCFDSLRTYGNFVKNCLEAQEQYIQSYIKTEEIDIKAEESDQDSDSSSYDLFEGTIKNEKGKQVSESSSKGEYESEYRNDLKHIDASELKEYKCAECGYRTKYNSWLKRHIILHKNPSEVRMYKCTKCDFQTKYEHSLTFHKLKHENVSKAQMYKCNVCCYETKYKRYLKLHQSHMHKDPSKIQVNQCDVCGYKATRKTHLHMHQLKHKDPSEIQMYKCDVCSYEARYKKSLIQHQLTHKNPSEIQMYKCQACGYETKRRDSLKRHRLTHEKAPKANKANM